MTNVSRIRGNHRLLRNSVIIAIVTGVVVGSLVLLVFWGWRSYNEILSHQSVQNIVNHQESKKLIQQLQAFKGVQRVDGGYSYDASNPGGSLVLSIGVENSNEAESVATEAIRLAWLSRLQPLSTVTITTGQQGHPSEAIDRHADFMFDKAKWTEKYGARPVVELQ